MRHCINHNATFIENSNVLSRENPSGEIDSEKVGNKNRMKKNCALVSVIVPTYNREDFIGEAIDSVLAQTYPDWELIIVDDGSEDQSADIIHQYAEKDKRIHYFYQENQGQSVARNLGLRQSQGDFICFLDSDNRWLPEKLAQGIQTFEQVPDVHVVYGDIITIDEQGQEITRDNMTRYSGFIAPRLIKDNFVTMNTAMAKRVCFDNMGGMSGQRRVADDYDLWLRFSAKFQFLYIQQYMAEYRVMKNQISSDKSRRFDSTEMILSEFKEQYPDAMSKEEFDQGFAYFYTRKARYFASIGNKSSALREVIVAIKYSPFYIAGWRSLLAILLRTSSRQV